MQEGCPIYGRLGPSCEVESTYKFWTHVTWAGHEHSFCIVMGGPRDTRGCYFVSACPRRTLVLQPPSHKIFSNPNMRHGQDFGRVKTAIKPLNGFLSGLPSWLGRNTSFRSTLGFYVSLHHIPILWGVAIDPLVIASCLRLVWCRLWHDRAMSWPISSLY